MTLDDARKLVAQFQEAMAEANAAIRETLRPNNYTVYNKTDVQEAVKPALYLGYGNSSTAAEKKRCVVWRR